MLFIVRLRDWEGLSPLWSLGKVGSGTDVTQPPPQETNTPEASQTKQNLGGGISVSGGGGGEWGRAGRAEAVLERNGTMAGLWAGAAPRPHYIPEASCDFRVEVGLQMMRAEGRQ